MKKVLKRQFNKSKILALLLTHGLSMTRLPFPVNKWRISDGKEFDTLAEIWTAYK